MVQTYCIYLPFQLAEGKEIANPLPFQGKIDSHPVEINRNGPYYAISFNRGESEKSAIEQFQKLIVGMYWFALETRSGVLMQQDLQEVSFPSDPVQAAKNIFGENTNRVVDVVIDGAWPAIWLHDRQHVKITAQPVKAVISCSPARLVQILNESMTLTNPVAVIENAKLKLALDLYCLSHFRSSDFARFLVLWTALEAAAPAPRLSTHSANLIDRWMDEARAAAASQDDQIAHDELQSLADRLRYLKTKSHRSRVRDYVRDMLKFQGSSDAVAIAREVSGLYDARGHLTHNGKYDLGNGLSRLDEIVCATLKASIRSVASANPRKPNA